MNDEIQKLRASFQELKGIDYSVFYHTPEKGNLVDTSENEYFVSQLEDVVRRKTCDGPLLYAKDNGHLVAEWHFDVLKEEGSGIVDGKEFSVEMKKNFDVYLNVSFLKSQENISIRTSLEDVQEEILGFLNLIKKEF